MCETYTNANPCKACGADTDRVPPETHEDDAMHVCPCGDEMLAWQADDHRRVCDVWIAQAAMNHMVSMAHQLVMPPPLRCCQCGGDFEDVPEVTPTGDLICSAECGRAWIAQLEGG